VSVSIGSITGSRRTRKERRKVMPLAQLKGLSGYLSAEQKAELIRKVTDAIVSVEGEGLRSVTWVILEEVPSGQWGVGGTPVTTEALRKMAAQGR
jgi:4-oxalocrotonate tautomerase